MTPCSFICIHTAEKYFRPYKKFFLLQEAPFSSISICFKVTGLVILNIYFQRFVNCSPLGSHHCKISHVTNICEDWIIDHTKSCVHCTWRACSQAVVLHITKGSLITRRVTWLHALTCIQICDNERTNKFILRLTVQIFTPNNDW